MSSPTPAGPAAVVRSNLGKTGADEAVHDRMDRLVWHDGKRLRQAGGRDIAGRFTSAIQAQGVEHCPCALALCREHGSGVHLEQIR